MGWLTSQSYELFSHNIPINHPIVGFIDGIFFWNSVFLGVILWNDMAWFMFFLFGHYDGLWMGNTVIYGNPIRDFHGITAGDFPCHVWRRRRLKFQKPQLVGTKIDITIAAFTTVTTSHIDLILIHELFVHNI